MAGDVTWIEILPSMQGFASALSTGTAKAAADAGKSSGTAWAKSFSGSAGDAGTAKVVAELEAASKRTKRAVDDQTQAIGKARAAQKEAAAKVVVAEEALTRARESGDPAKIEAAELRLGAARDRAEASTKKVESSEDALRAAKNEHKEVTGQLEAATKDLDTAQSGAARSAEEQGRALESVKAGLRTAAVAAVAVGAAVLGAGAALFKVGEQFDSMSDSIRIGTGAQGEALDALTASARTVATSVPTDFARAGQTIADVNTRLGLSGSTLETVAKQALEAGRMLGTELDLERVSGSLSAFRVEGESTVGALDHLWRVSQATGIGMNDLAAKVEAQAPAVQELGFSYEQTATMVGALDKAGLNADQVLSGMGRSLVNLARQGEEPADAFRRVVGEIEGFLAAGDSAAAIDMAGKVFGTRGATQFIGAIQSGALALDDLDAMASSAGDTILGASAETMDFAEHWQMFKNDLLVQIEPAATAVFSAISQGMGWIRENGLPVLKDLASQAQERLLPAFQTIGGFVRDTLIPGFSTLVGWLKQNQEWLLPLAAGVVSMVVAYKTYTTVMAVVRGVTVAYTAAQAALNLVMSANPIGIIVLLLAGLVAGLVVAYQRSETFRNIVQGVWQAVQSAAVTAWEWMQGVFENIKTGLAWVGDAFVTVRDGISSAWQWVTDKLAAGWNFIYTWVLLPWRMAFAVAQRSFELVVQGVSVAWQWVQGVLSAGWSWIDRNVLAPFRLGLSLVGAGFEAFRDLAGRVWSAVQTAAETAWKWLDTNVFTHLKAGVTAIGTVFEATRDVISAAWDRVKEAAAAPVRFVVNTVYREGIKATWDRIASAVGISLSLPTITLPFADGGFHEQHSAQIAPAGAMRVWAEPETGGEAYIPLAASKRSRSVGILGEVADRFGMSLVPFADGGIWDTIGGAVSSAASFASSAVSAIAGFLTDPANAIRDAITAPVNTLLERIGGGQLGQLLVELPRKVIAGLVQKAKDLVASMFSPSGGAEYSGPMVGGWRRPSAGRVTSEYGPRWGAFHAGIDVANGAGTPVYAAAAGQVLRTGWGALAGRTGVGIILSHGAGTYSYYGHNPANGVTVQPGQVVAGGQRIGAQGSTGNVTGPHLHFELHRGGLGNTVNPRVLGVFDSGGFLQPGDVGVNFSRSPEPVLTAQQWSDIHTLAMSAAPAASGGDDLASMLRDGRVRVVLDVGGVGRLTEMVSGRLISTSARGPR